MTTPHTPLQTVLSQLCTPVRSDGRASIIAATSAHTGVGTSYISRNLALLAAEHYNNYGQRVALIDLDLSGQAQFSFFSQPSSAQEHNLSGPYDATFGRIPFWQVSPDVVDAAGGRANGSKYGALYLLGQSGLVVTKFNWNEVKEGQNVHIITAPEYWDALRNQFALIIIDTPAFDRSDTALSVIPEADKTIIITTTERAQDLDQKQLADNITAYQGVFSGLVLNDGPNILNLNDVI